MMKEDWVYRRGDIYLANLGKPEGSQQGGVRPVVILQNDIGNYYSPTLTLAPLTSKTEKKKRQPTHYYIRKAKVAKIHKTETFSTLHARQNPEPEHSLPAVSLESSRSDSRRTGQDPESSKRRVDKLILYENH